VCARAHVTNKKESTNYLITLMDKGLILVSLSTYGNLTSEPCGSDNQCTSDNHPKLGE